MVDMRMPHLDYMRPENDPWVQANSAFIDSIINEPHPMRTNKMMSKRHPDWASVFPPEYMTDFLTFRSASAALGLSGPGIASSDLMFFLTKNPRIFVIEEAIGNLLRKTDLRGATIDMLRLPYPVVYFQMPKNDIPVWSNFMEEGKLEGVYVTESKPESNYSGIVLLCIGKDPNLHPLDDCLWSMPFALDTTKTLEDAVKDRIEEVKGRKTGAELLNVERSLEVFTWVINCILYVNSSGADVKEEWLHQGLAKKARQATGSKKTKLKRQLESTSARIIRVGAGIKYDPEPKESTGDYKERKLHWARGHWRWQPCGPGWSETKHIWIKPHLRGKGRDIVDKMYQVK